MKVLEAVRLWWGEKRGRLINFGQGSCKNMGIIRFSVVAIVT